MAETGKAEDEHKGDGEEVTINLTGFPPCFSRTEKSAAKDGKGKRSGWRLLSTAVKPPCLTWGVMAAEPKLMDCWYQKDTSAPSPAAFFVQVGFSSVPLLSSGSSINCKKTNAVQNRAAQERRRVGHCENGDWNRREWEKYRCRICRRSGVCCAGGCLTAIPGLTSHFTS